jgi:TRAP-type C4-dicarboxylate transport system substrate-binding protein
MKLWKLALGALCLFGLGFCFPTPSSFAQTKPIELSYSIFFPAPHRNTVLAGEWAKEIEKRTNEMVKITVYPGGTLTPADKCYDGVEKGISDIGMSVLSYTMGKFPLSEVIDLPLGYKSGVVATKLINSYYKKFRPKELDSTQVMYFHAHGPGFLHTKKAVHKLEDLKGMKIRCTGMAAKVVIALGGVPVAMPMGETYDALNRGVVDGSMAPQEALQGWKWGEVVKFTTECFGAAYSSGFFVVMNKDKWNKLSPDIQKIIARVNEEWIEKSGRNWDEIERAGREFTLKLGNQIIPLSPEENERWAKAVYPILGDYVNRMKAKGLPGEEALQFCLDQLKKAP